MKLYRILTLCGLLMLIATAARAVQCNTCDLSLTTGVSSGSTLGTPSASIGVTDPGVFPGDQVYCAISYDNPALGILMPDPSWTDLYDGTVSGGSVGFSLVHQTFPGGSYSSPVAFTNFDGFVTENWGYSCIAISNRYGADGGIQPASGGPSTTAIAPPVTITQTLDISLNFFITASNPILSSPTTGTIATQQNTFAPTTGIVMSTVNPTVSPVPANSVTLSGSQPWGALTLALKCAAPPAPTATSTATPTITATPTATATGATPTATPTPGTFISNVVVIDMENRSFDNIFGLFPGANGASTATLSTGATIPILHAPNGYPADFDHSRTAALADINVNQMNGWDLQGNCKATSSPTPYSCISQFTSADLPNLWEYAQDFALGDAAFASLLGPSLPAHLYLTSATSNMIYDNPNFTGASNSWGCDGPVLVTDCTANGMSSFGPAPCCTGAGTGPTCTSTKTSTSPILGSSNRIRPCFTSTGTGSSAMPSLFDALETAGITWKSYGVTSGATSGYQWTDPNHYLNHANGTADWTSHVVSDANFAADAAAGTLPQVTFFTTQNWNSGHPPESMCTDENYIVRAINGIAAGSQWAHMLIIVTWDDWGGIYDHVVPPVHGSDGMGYGMRVPFIVISPYARPGRTNRSIACTVGSPCSVVHTTIDAFASINLEIQEIFGLPSFGKNDATTADLSTFLDFTQTPLTLPTLTENTATACHTIPWP